MQTAPSNDNTIPFPAGRARRPSRETKRALEDAALAKLREGMSVLLTGCFADLAATHAPAAIHRELGAAALRQSARFMLLGRTDPRGPLDHSIADVIGGVLGESHDPKFYDQRKDHAE